MTSDTPQETNGLLSPGRPASDGNSSIQVNIDASSHRGRSRGRRSRSPSTRCSPSRASEPSLARQATTHPLPSFLSPRPSPQPSSGDCPPHEDYLRDLIPVTGFSIDAVRGGQHGVKRPHDDEATDEPQAKRDKLGEELERMSAPPSAPVAVMAASPSPAVSASALPTMNGSQIVVPGDRPLVSRIRDALPIRHPAQRPPRLGSGTAMSRNGIPEALEPPLDHETDHSADGRGTHGETSP